MVPKATMAVAVTGPNPVSRSSACPAPTENTSSAGHARDEGDQAQDQRPADRAVRASDTTGNAIQRAQVGVAGGDDIAGQLRLDDGFAPARYQHPPEQYPARLSAEAGRQQNFTGTDDGSRDDDARAQMLEAPDETRWRFGNLARPLGVEIN